ncbi:MAG: response regulator [Rhodospirillales bacterium]|nr:response regulator [Rhodospirillales bacterium]
MAFDFKKLSVLVVEDTAPMRKLIMSVLETLGVGLVYSAENGEDGFAAFCKYNPDIVIADWHMEPINGIELAQEIRTSVMSSNRMVPIILITGYSALSRVAQARDAGVTEFLVKPFSANDLAKRIAYVINKPRDFIDSHDYFGPDRRRRIQPDYKGPFRRDEDQANG